MRKFDVELHLIFMYQLISVTKYYDFSIGASILPNVSGMQL